MLRMGLIGLGGVSRHSVGAIQRSSVLELVAVCDTRPERVAAFAADAPIARSGPAAELLEDERVEAVVVDTPVITHVELARRALEAGRHVCCEKPLALSRADAEALLRIAERSGLTLFTAFHRRYNRGIATAGPIDSEGISSVESRYYERIEDHARETQWHEQPAARGGGCVVDNGPNAFDVARHVVGTMTIDEVEVHRRRGVDVNALIRGRAHSAEVVIKLDWAYDGEQKDLRVRWRDGREWYVDMLDGFHVFKSSLDHEYDGVLADFAAHVAEHRQDPFGLEATAWLEDVLACAETGTR